MNPRWKHYKNKRYEAYVRGLKCLVCDSEEPDPHHVYRRGNDYSCVPLCREHHSIFHSRGRDFFEREFNLDLDHEIINLMSEFIDGSSL